MIELSLLTEAPIQFAAAVLDGLRVSQEMTAFEQLAKAAEHYVDLYQWRPLSEIPDVQNARRFFRAIGVDPTKRRPSSEALLNRALKHKELYSVNTLVDVGNWCSLEFLLPTCVYDAGRLRGPITVRLGTAGESYEALNHREIDFADRLVLADDQGPFGSPMTDSLRTATSPATRRSLVGIWAPADYEKKRLQEQIDLFAERCIKMCGGKLVEVHLLPE